MCVFSYPNVMFVFPTAMLCMLASPMLCVTEIMMVVMMVLKMIKKMTTFISVRCSMHVIQYSDIFFGWYCSKNSFDKVQYFWEYSEGYQRISMFWRCLGIIMMLQCFPKKQMLRCSDWITMLNFFKDINVQILSLDKEDFIFLRNKCSDVVRGWLVRRRRRRVQAWWLLA